MTHELLKEFPVIVEIPLAWGEMDAFQHVNNVAYFRYIETGRIAYFERLGFLKMMKESGIGPILGSVQCRFKIPLVFPDTISLGTRISQMSEDRITMTHRILSHKLQKIVAEGESIGVSYDYNTLKKAPLPEAMKKKIFELEGEGLHGMKEPI